MLHNNVPALTVIHRSSCMLNECEPSLPWHWHHRLQAHGILEAMDVSGMEQVKTEK